MGAIPEAERRHYTSPFRAKIVFLVDHGALALEHSGASLLHHLVGTHRLLQEWGESTPVCDGGLFHSVYGTATFTDAALAVSARSELRLLIGTRAERLAYLFCAMDRPAFCSALRKGRPAQIRDRLTGQTEAVDAPVVRDLCTMAVANCLDQLRRTPQTGAGSALRLPPEIASCGSRAAQDAFQQAAEAQP